MSKKKLIITLTAEGEMLYVIPKLVAMPKGTLQALAKTFGVAVRGTKREIAWRIRDAAHIKSQAELFVK